jgi:hypothetical protein
MSNYFFFLLLEQVAKLAKLLLMEDQSFIQGFLPLARLATGGNEACLPAT